MKFLFQTITARIIASTIAVLVVFFVISAAEAQWLMKPPILRDPPSSTGIAPPVTFAWEVADADNGTGAHTLAGSIVYDVYVCPGAGCNPLSTAPAFTNITGDVNTGGDCRGSLTPPVCLTTVYTTFPNTTYRWLVRAIDVGTPANYEDSAIGQFTTKDVTQPDFIVHKVNGPGTPDPPTGWSTSNVGSVCNTSQIYFNYELENIGNANGGYFSTRLFVDGNYVTEEFYPANLLPAERTSATSAQSCQTSQSYDGTMCWTPPGPGTYNIQIKADSFDNIINCSGSGDPWVATEINEANNCTPNFTLTVGSIPATPNPALSSATTNSITWDWPDVPGATDYRVFLNGTLLASNHPVSDYTTIGLTANTQYGLNAGSNSSCGSSTLNSAAFGFTRIEDATGASATNATTSGYDVSAQGALSNLTSGSSGIQYRAVANSVSCAASAEDTAVVNNTNPVSFTKLLAGTQYWTCVRTQNGDGLQNSWVGPFSPIRTLAANNPPSLSWDNPLNSDTIAGSPSLRVDATDPDAGDSVSQVLWCYSATGACNATDPTKTLTYDSVSSFWSGVWDTTTVSDGSYFLCARATDANAATTDACINVTVHNTPAPQPDIIITPVGTWPTTVAQNATVNFTYTAQNIGTGDAGAFTNVIYANGVAGNSILLPLGMTAGAQNTNGLSWVATTCGPNTIRIKGDASTTGALDCAGGVGGVIVESDETNNCSIEATVNVDCSAPNLKSTIFTVTPPTEGQPVSFAGSINNLGNADAGASSARFCIGGTAADCDAGGTSTTHGNLKSVPALVAVTGTSSVTSDPWTAVAGTYTVHLCADGLKAVSESDENDNCSSTTFTVGAAPMPDLIIEKVGTWPSTANDGDVLNLIFVTREVGNAPASGFTDALFVDNNKVSSLSNRSVSANGSNTVGISWTATCSGSAATETHTLQIKADVGTQSSMTCANGVGGTVTEGNETNNCSPAQTVTITCPPPLPNFVIDELVANWSGDICPGDSLSLDTTILNNKSGAAPSVSSAGIFDNGNVVCQSTTPALAGNSSDTYSCTWVAPAAGPHTIQSIADVGSTVTETDETDNSMSTVLTVSDDPLICGEAIADLDCSGVVDVIDLGIMISWMQGGSYPNTSITAAPGGPAYPAPKSVSSAGEWAGCRGYSAGGGTTCREVNEVCSGDGSLNCCSGLTCTASTVDSIGVCITPSTGGGSTGGWLPDGSQCLAANECQSGRCTRSLPTDKWGVCGLAP